MMPSTPPRSDYSSPQPGAKNSFEELRSSPPPPPHRVHNSTSSEPAVGSVLSEINSGRSILSPKPVDMFKISGLTRETLFEELACEEKDGRSTRPRLNSGMILVSPSSSHFGSPLSANDFVDEEEVDEDMPPMPSPIRLPMRCSPPRSTIAPRVSGGFMGRPFLQRPSAFLPIRPHGGDHQNGL